VGVQVYYDDKEEVIVIDFTNLTVTREIMDKAVADTIEIVKMLPRKVWAFACYYNSKIDQEILTSGYYGLKLAELHEYVHGIIRYGVDNLYARSGIRTQKVKYPSSGSRANFYNTKEEALTALRRGDVLLSQTRS
jgi:hypothetical protein